MWPLGLEVPVQFFICLMKRSTRVGCRFRVGIRWVEGCYPPTATVYHIPQIHLKKNMYRCIYIGLYKMERMVRLTAPRPLPRFSVGSRTAFVAGHGCASSDGCSLL